MGITMRIVLILTLLLAHVDVTSSFAIPGSSSRLFSLTILHANSQSSSFGDGQRKQEKYMEAMSLQGAAQIAKMNISERTTRALLAEAVEDRIFQLQDDLEQLSGGSVPDDEAVKAQCVEIAKTIRRSQIQYNDLVSGAPSELLNSMQSWEKTQKADNELDADEDVNGSTFE
ncbi:hypothetical protein MPSEU_000300800 [Mayamaea pseudoterrestris]|nr:hypothetical protein MPSEU_000300800 [Mayamaea pseudoterrestris]